MIDKMIVSSDENKSSIIFEKDKFSELSEMRMEFPEIF